MFINIEEFEKKNIKYLQTHFIYSKYLNFIFETSTNFRSDSNICK
jgi:hypothetical protein